MFFSQLKINISRQSVITLLKSDEHLHACIAASTENSKRQLWRLDNRIIYVVSDAEPDFTGFIERYGWPRLPYESTVRTVDYGRFLDKITDNSQWYFEIVVNPTIKSNGKIIPLIRDNADKWLQDKLSPAARIDDLRLEDEPTSIFVKNHHQVKIRKRRYRGILTVSDVDTMRTLLTSGIGREKAYGCGLLTIMPKV